jgi:hypothetical protein
MAKLKDLLASASNGCDEKIGGIVKMWLGRVSELTGLTCAAVSGTYEITAITMSGDYLGIYEFSDNKTGFVNETPGDVGAPNAVQISCEYEGITADAINRFNEIKSECKLFAFVKYKNGEIRLFGIDITAPSSNTYSTAVTAFRAKPGSQSGVGNNDYSKMTLEVVGEMKTIAYTCETSTFGEDELDALAA